MTASPIFIPLAERGNAAAQSYVGFLFETGRDVPQNYTEAAMWYHRAAEQGEGLLYDCGQGVPQDIVEASKWRNLSTAASPPRVRESRARIRDAVNTKMTRRDRPDRPVGDWNGRQAASSDRLTTGLGNIVENNPMHSRFRRTVPCRAGLCGRDDSARVHQTLALPAAEPSGAFNARVGRA